MLVAALASIPLIMIVVNGRRALEGILWQEKPMPEIVSEASSYYPEITFGVYDPKAAHQGNDLFGLEMVYLSWLQTYDHDMLVTLRDIHAAGRQAIITVEPWNKDDRTGGELLTAIADGTYDEEIDRVVDLLNDYGEDVLISFGHEMDQQLAERYPWSGIFPSEFQEAYRYFWKRVEGSVVQEVSWIWAPVVQPNCTDFWPGDDYVDIIGMPIYSCPEWDRGYYGYIRSFESTMAEKIQHVKRLQKPIMIVEFGVTGGPYYEHYWLQEAFQGFGQVPGIQSVVFFQSADTDGAWGSDLGTPNWHVDEALLSGMVSWYQQQAAMADSPQEASF